MARGKGGKTNNGANLGKKTIMTIPDDLSSLKEFSRNLDDLDELMAQQGRVFLIGAGFSKCAGLPLAEKFIGEIMS